MKKLIFQWNNILYTGIAISVIAYLFFFSAFFTVDTSYHSICLKCFMWTSSIGVGFCAIWVLPYTLGFISKIIRYYRYGY